MLKVHHIFFLIVLGVLAASCNTESKIENEVADANYPLPKVIEPVAKPVAEPVMETADEVLKERTVADTRKPGQKGGYKATVFPKSDSTSDDGTAFKISW